MVEAMTIIDGVVRIEQVIETNTNEETLERSRFCAVEEEEARILAEIANLDKILSDLQIEKIFK